MPSRPPDRERFAPIATQCLARKLRMLNRGVSALYDEALRPYGIKVSQMNVLVAVAVLGPTRQVTVAERLMLEKSTLSRNVEPMRRSGWIAVSEGEDQRSHELSLTDSGRALLQELTPAWREVQRRVQRLIGADGMKGVDRMLSALRGRAT